MKRPTGRRLELSKESVLTLDFRARLGRKRPLRSSDPGKVRHLNIEGGALGGSSLSMPHRWPTGCLPGPLPSP
jgi:hypothetical protein